jgi:BlaI family transcriptional regulator, penicillinase repressor
MATPRLGRVQWKIMRVLWQRGRVSAREITEALARTEPIAHSTVQTLLRKLEAKGAVAHDIEERTFVFYSLVEQEKVKGGAVRDLVDRVFDRSTAELVSYLLQNERVPPEELDRIRKLIDQKKRKES